MVAANPALGLALVLTGATLFVVNAGASRPLVETSTLDVRRCASGTIEP